MVDARVGETATVTGEVTVASYDYHALKAADPAFDRLLPIEKYRYCKRMGEPRREVTTTNVATEGLFEFIGLVMNTATPVPDLPNEVAFGTGSTTPSKTDSSLTTPVDRVDITEYDALSNGIRIGVFVGTGEANVNTSAGETISELGVYAGSRLCNHALLPTEFEKDEQTTMTTDVTLTFDAA